MKVIESWNDLEWYGIFRLTGEACPFGMRQLCDLTEKGALILRSFFGFAHDAKLNANWNSGSGYSAMIPMSVLNDLKVFCLFSDGAAKVLLLKDGSAVGYYPEDSEQDYLTHWQILMSTNSLERDYVPVAGPRLGTRMIHGMSGRSE